MLLSSIKWNKRNQKKKKTTERKLFSRGEDEKKWNGATTHNIQIEKPKIQTQTINEFDSRVKNTSYFAKFVAIPSFLSLTAEKCVLCVRKFTIFACSDYNPTDISELVFV